MKTFARVVILALCGAVSTTALAEQPPNPMHPVFAPRDASGKPVKDSAEVSADATCGSCHDATFINTHSEHARGHAKATCIQCHLDRGRLAVGLLDVDENGLLKREALRIGSPRPANCAACHGLISDGSDAVLIPPDFEQGKGPAPAGTPRVFSLTRGEGAIVAPQRMADSFLNLEGKSTLAVPWDVHAAKLVDCAACHYAPNNPGRLDAKQRQLDYMTVDPRRQSTADFLARPDHRFAEPSCQSCHDATRTHEFLPYRARHMEVVACSTCHIPGPMGPTVEMMDATVATLSGGPVFHYRNVEKRAGEPLNAALLKPFPPLLVMRTEADGGHRLAPVNVMTRYRWVSGSAREAVSSAKVAEAFLAKGEYAPEILAAFDTNRDGRLDNEELRIDTVLKNNLVASRLAAAGAVSPEIEGTMKAYPLAHGVAARSRALRDCDGCHATDSRLSASFAITPFLPGGVMPKPRGDARVDLGGDLVRTADGGLAFEHKNRAVPGRLYVLGQSRHALSNRIGFLIFVAVFLGVLAHGVLRIVIRRRHRGALSDHAPKVAAKKTYVFGRYERLWHWTMAGSSVALILTGLDVHSAGTVLSLPRAVALHNLAGAVLTVNALLGLFYHLTTVAIRKFIPSLRGFLKGVTEHLDYQSRGIFYGAPHPSQAPDQTLNPLQQVTYLALLNLLFPAQIVTGTLLWAIGRFPEVAAKVGGLSTVAPIHNFTAWLFLSFFVLHTYLVTTGRTLGDHLGAMITGYRAVDPDHEKP